MQNISICAVQIQPRKHALGRAGYTTATTRQHELDHTDHADRDVLSALKNLDHEEGIKNLSDRDVKHCYSQNERRQVCTVVDRFRGLLSSPRLLPQENG